MCENSMSIPILVIPQRYLFKSNQWNDFVISRRTQMSSLYLVVYFTIAQKEL